jgi:hypothetical protein
MGRYITLLLFISVAFPQLSIEGKRIHNHEINEYYSDDEFINRLNSDPNFVNDENFLSYKKYVNRLKSKGSKCIYCFSFGSIAAGFDGINNPDDFQDEDNPPGLQNIAFGILLPLSYHTYNSAKKRITLYNVIQRHNDIYSKDEIKDFPPPDRWDSSVSYGFLSEKIPVSIIEYSRLLNIDEHSDFYLAIGSMLFGSGVGSGYKYYFKNKYTSSKFISLGSHISHLGTADSQGITIYGISISPGYSIIYKGKSSFKITYRKRFGGELKEAEYKKSAINIGISFMYLGDNSIGAYPFMNLERRF